MKKKKKRARETGGEGGGGGGDRAWARSSGLEDPGLELLLCSSGEMLGEGCGWNVRIWHLKHTHVHPPRHSHQHRCPPLPPVPLQRFPGTTRMPQKQILVGKPKPHLLCEDTRATKQPAAMCRRGQEGKGSIPSPCPWERSDLGQRVAGKPPGHPNPKIPRGLAGKIPPKLTPFFKQLNSLSFSLSRSSAVPLTMSPCPGDASSLWMLPWKGPQEKPSGRLLRLRTRRSPS